MNSKWSDAEGPLVQDAGLEYLLGLDGDIQVQNDEGYWLKYEVARVDVTPDRPHGIKYSLHAA